VPGVGVAKTVDVSVKKNLVRADAVALQDGGKSVVGLVEAKVAPVGTDRSYGTYLPQGIYGARLLFLFLQEQIKDIIISS
jgi:hypothetical protein